MRNVVLLALVLGLALPSDVEACSCIEQSLEEAVDRADAVFVGTVKKLEVLEVKDGISTIRATVEPKAVAVGSLAAEVEFLTSNGCCYCAFQFEIAETYLLFATVSEGRLDTSTCSRSQPIRKAAEDLAALGLDEALAGE